MLRKERTKHVLFELALLAKGIYGFFEMLSGIALALIPLTVISNLIINVFSHELIEDPGDVVALHITSAVAHTTTGTKEFIALYLCIYGAIKIFLVISLWKQKLWAYPIASTVIGIFILYQLFLLTKHFTWSLVVLIIIDCVVLGLIHNEFLRTKNKYSHT